MNLENFLYFKLLSLNEKYNNYKAKKICFIFEIYFLV